MSARGRNTRLIGSKTASYGGQSSSRPAADCSPVGTRSGLMPHASRSRRGLLADRGHLDAGEGAGVQAVLLELLADGLDRVARGERDPLVAAGHQALDRPLHLLRGARRLDRDGRHLLGHRAVRRAAASDSAPACSLVRGTSTRQPNSGLVSNQISVSRSDDRVADDGDGRRGQLGGLHVGGDPLERRGDRALVGRGAGWVTATGVSGDRPAAISAFATSPMTWVARQQHQGRRPRGDGRPVGRAPVPSATLTTRTSRCLADGQRDPGVRRDRGDRRRRRAPPRTGSRPSRTPAPPRSRWRRGTGRRRAAARRCRRLLAAFDDEAGAHRVAERLAVVAERAVDDLDVVAAEPPDEGRVLRLGDDDVGLREQLDGSHRQQLGVTGAGADEGDGAQRRLLRVVVLLLVVFGRVTGRAPTSDRPHPRRAARPRGRGRSVQPRREVRWRTAGRCAEPSSRADDGSQVQLGVVLAARRASPRAPTGAEQPASSAASRARSAVTTCRVAASSSTCEQVGDLGRAWVVRAAALDRQRALAGGGQHLDGVDRLGDRVEAAEPGQPGARQDDGVELAVRDQPEPGVDVAADGDDLEAEAERAQLGGPPRRAGADPRAGGQLGQGRARRGPPARRGGPRAAAPRRAGGRRRRRSAGP